MHRSHLRASRDEHCRHSRVARLHLREQEATTGASYMRSAHMCSARGLQQLPPVLLGDNGPALGASGHPAVGLQQANQPPRATAKECRVGVGDARMQSP